MITRQSFQSISTSIADGVGSRTFVWAAIAVGAAIATVVALGAAPQDAGKAPGVATSDALFLRTAGQGGKGEVELAKLANDHSTNDGVKSYADMLKHDHGQANSDLASMASARGVTIADVSTDTRATETKLSSLNGLAFDKSFLATMVSDHESAISAFTKESKDTKDADLRAFADKTLPVLKDHLQHAKDLQKALK